MRSVAAVGSSTAGAPTHLCTSPSIRASDVGGRSYGRCVGTHRNRLVARRRGSRPATWNDSLQATEREHKEHAMPSPADREKALESALAQIDRQFGKGSVMRLGSDERAPVEVIPTGSIALDVALGIGGLPRGRIVEIYGPESSGKTTLTLHAIADAQKAGRHRRVHRRRARARPRLRAEARRRHRRAARLAARHRRAGARDRRHAGPLRRHRPHRHRLGRRARAQGRDRGRDGRLARRPAGAPHVAGAAQAHRWAQPAPTPR